MNDRDRWKIHRRLALASCFAYRDDVNQGQDYVGFEFVEVGPAAGYVAWNDEWIVVAFRGTNNLVDWWYNARLISDKTEHKGRHAGFELQTMALYPRVSTIIKHLMRDQPARQILTCGHSLGGAVAIYTAVRLTDDGFPTYATDTFGCSPVYRKFYFERTQFRPLHWVQNGTTRFTHGNDIVPRLLPGWAHVGNHIHLGKPVRWWRTYKIVSDHNIRLYAGQVNLAMEGLG